ncbi:hypothetical protein AALP_AA6G158300 [Arabis alpina]|uniref:Integrase catalytic domain-containing protein n=1 Tax=Arabis alpina TaxID=50452 RepID=A0A087GPI5_ARAAL|nr:hypothetical protein AALP_AA6G158300 [Arabis alpina]
MYDRGDGRSCWLTMTWTLSTIRVRLTLWQMLLVGGEEPLGLAEVDQVDLLSRIRVAQEKDQCMDRVCVTKDEDLRQEILREAHASKFSIHPGATKMYRDLKRFYHWVGMKRDVADWVAAYNVCQLMKAEHQVPSGLLQSLPIPEWKWDMITMDFVVGLPVSRTYDAIWVIVDRLTKSPHFFAIKKTDGAEVLAKKYVKEIVRFHGVSATIVSDRDPRFASVFWRDFQAEMGTKVHMSTVNHPQTDGQSEKTIQKLEDLLRMCVLDWGGHWADHLSLVEFAYNNSFQASIGDDGEDLCCEAKHEEAQDRQKSYADKRRKQLEFAVGDRVYLNRAMMRDLNKSISKDKLSTRYMGPFRVVERNGPVVYRLELPPIMEKFHNLFHVSKLRRCLHTSEEVMRRKRVSLLRGLWDCDSVREETWEPEDKMKTKFKKWFEKQAEE